MDKRQTGNMRNDKEVDVLAVSMKPSPIFKGESAKKIIDAMSKPSNNAELFKKCKELSKIFTMK